MRKRAVIVGNGPSLRATPLENIEGDTFATNRIGVLYPDTRWRPDYYVRVETPTDEDVEGSRAEVMEQISLGIKCFFPTAWREWAGSHPNVTYFWACKHYKYPEGHKKAPKHWHLPSPCDYGTVATTCIQIAVLLGYEEIYLVGCDLGYSEDADNHFYDSSHEKRQPPNQANRNMLDAHRIALSDCPVPIMNATIGGYLDVYPRVSINEILRS